MTQISEPVCGTQACLCRHYDLKAANTTSDQMAELIDFVCVAYIEINSVSEAGTEYSGKEEAKTKANVTKAGHTDGEAIGVGEQIFEPHISITLVNDQHESPTWKSGEHKVVYSWKIKSGS